MSPSGQPRSGRRRSSQSRSAHVVVRKASPDHGIASGANVAISSASGGRGRGPADDPRLERDRHDGRLEPRVQPDDLARLDEQPGLLPGLADGRLVDRLVDLEEAARLGPRAATRLDAAAEQDELAVVGDRQRRDDEPRVDVGDVAARRARQPVAVLAVEIAPNRSAVAAARAEVEASRPSSRGTPRPGGEVGRAAVAARVEARPVAVRRAGRRRRRATSAARPTRLTATQARRNQALAAIDRHPRPGRAPDAEDRVGRRDDEQRRGDQDAQLDERVAERRAEVERGDRDRAADEHDDRQVDVVPLERRRGDLGHGARRQALEARRQGRRRARTAAWRSSTGMPGLPAFVVHRHDRRV